MALQKLALKKKIESSTAKKNLLTLENYLSKQIGTHYLKYIIGSTYANDDKIYDLFNIKNSPIVSQIVSKPTNLRTSFRRTKGKLTGT